MEGDDAIEKALHDGMLNAVIQRGVRDHVLPVGAIGQQLLAGSVGTMGKYRSGNTGSHSHADPPAGRL